MNESGFIPEEEVGNKSHYKDPREDVDVVKISKIIDRCIDGDQSAKEELLKEYEWLIDSIIIKYFDKENDTENEDLKQEGRVAILNSIKNFDKGKIINPTQYLRDAIYHHLVNIMRVNQPIHIGEQIHRVRKFESISTQNPDATGTDFDMTEEELEDTRKAARAIEAIENIDVDETENIESLTAEQQQAIEVLVTNKEILKELESFCSPREIEIMKLKFGFDGQERTLEKVGDEINISRQRAEQILKSTLNKIRDYLNVSIEKPKAIKELTPEEIQQKINAFKQQHEHRMNELFNDAVGGDMVSREKFIDNYIIDHENFLGFFHINYRNLDYDEIVNETKNFIGETISRKDTFSTKQLNDHLLDWAEKRREETKEQDKMTNLMNRAIHDLEARKEFIESHEPLIDEIIDRDFQKYKALDYETMKKRGISEVYMYFTIANFRKYSKEEVSNNIYDSLHSWVLNLPKKYRL